MTPMQKFVYAKARAYWEDKDTPKDANPSITRAQRAIR